MKFIKELVKKVTGDPKNPQALISVLYQHCFCNPDPVKQLDWQALMIEFNRLVSLEVPDNDPEYILVHLRMEELSRKNSPNEKETLNEYRMAIKKIDKKFPDGPPVDSEEYYIRKAYQLGIKRLNSLCRSIDKNVY